MAGGKETPRQKLIGLMYLVLLAMLALQVSSAILQKFQFLNASLEQGVKNASALNETKIGSIEKAVEKAPKYKPVLDEAKQVKKEAGDMIAYIEAMVSTKRATMLALKTKTKLPTTWWATLQQAKKARLSK